MRIIVTGSREWYDVFAIMDTFALVSERWALAHPADTVRMVSVGDCPSGVDLITKKIVQHPLVPGWHFQEYEAHWHQRGKAAGPLRNKRMVQGGGDVCLAFPGRYSEGTIDCAKRAFAAGIPVVARGCTDRLPASLRWVTPETYSPTRPNSLPNWRDYSHG